MTEKELTEEEKKESRRETQLKILKDSGTKDLYIAGSGLSGDYGKIGEAATISNYLRAMTELGDGVGKMVSNSYALMAQHAIQSGQNPYDTGGLTPRQLIKNARGIYESAINYVKVSDILELMGIKGVHEKRVSKEQKNMYMEELKESNKELYEQLVSVYFGSLENIGVGESFIESGKGLKKNLESILLTPLKDEKEKKSD